MTTITINPTQKNQNVKCGTWLLVDSYDTKTLCVVAQVNSQHFQLICIKENEANRFIETYIHSGNGYTSFFTPLEVHNLTNGYPYEVVDVQISVTN